MVEKCLFLPGASGSRQFWQPLADRVVDDKDCLFVGWPGLDGVPPDPNIQSLSGLVDLVSASVDGPVDILAQSMGGVVAMQTALRLPHLVKHLVLTATSGGIDMSRFQAADWRKSYTANLPSAPPWFVDDRTDLSGLLPTLDVPVLLILGDADPICPIAAGEYLIELLPDARLIIVEGGDHMLARDRADELAPLIAGFLSS